MAPVALAAAGRRPADLGARAALALVAGGRPAPGRRGPPCPAGRRPVFGVPRRDHRRLRRWAAGLRAQPQSPCRARSASEWNGCCTWTWCPGSEPLLLREYGVEPVRISTESFAKVIAVVAADAGPTALPPHAGRTAVLLGQYLPDLQLLTRDEERGLHLEMVEGVVAAGYAELVFKAHPGAPAGLTGPLVARAAELGARLQVRESPELVETWYAAGAVDLAVSCFSTALASGRPVRGAHRPGRHRAAAGTAEPLPQQQPDARRGDRGDGTAAEPAGGRTGPGRSAGGRCRAPAGRPRSATSCSPPATPDLRGPAAELLEQRSTTCSPTSGGSAHQAEAARGSRAA